MSLILDALTRAETEKRSAESDTADLLTPAPADTKDRFPPWTVPALALLAGVLTTSLVFFVVNQGDPADQADQQVPPPVAVKGPAPSTAKGAVRNGAQDSPAASPPTESPAVGAVNRPHPAVSPVAAIDSDRSQPVAQQQRTDSRVAALYAQREESAQDPAVDAQSATGPVSSAAEPEADPEPAMTETPVDLDAVLREVREEARSDGLEPHPAPLLADLSQQFRNRVPTLMYLRHDFNGQGRSTVLINGQTLAAGQRTKGVEVREILGDSVILRYDGTEFRLRALNSWVNL